MMDFFKGLSAISSSVLVFGLVTFAADGIALEGWALCYMAGLAFASCVGLCGMWRTWAK